MGLGSRESGGLVGRFGPRLPLMIGPVATGLGFVLLTVWRAPPLVVVVISAAGGILLALFNG